MPCNDGSGANFALVEDLHRERNNRYRIEAMLCAALTFLESKKQFDAFLKATDWKEAGISRKRLLRWWEEHQEQDRLRRIREAKERKEQEKKDRLKLRAYEKLTPAEREALNLPKLLDE
jgi:hypothetical protein